MDIEADTFALFVLSELPGVGERTLARVQEQARRKGRPLGETLALPPVVLKEELGLPPAAVTQLTDRYREHESYCRATLRRLVQTEVAVYRPGNSMFPRRWVDCPRPCPPIVYQHGNPSVLDTPTVAILSSRDITERSVIATVRTIRAVARDGFTLVTGGMKTTHRIAAVSGRATGAKRAIVLDRGILAAFGKHAGRDPFGFSPGKARFDPAACLVLSSFRPNNHASPRSGRRRDELIAGLADLIVVTHARAGGEIERLSLLALDGGQPVLSWQAENAALMAAGAGAIDESDLESDLRRFIRPPDSSPEPQPAPARPLFTLPASRRR